MNWNHWEFWREPGPNPDYQDKKEAAQEVREDKERGGLTITTTKAKTSKAQRTQKCKLNEDLMSAQAPYQNGVAVCPHSRAEPLVGLEIHLNFCVIQEDGAIPWRKTRQQ